MRTIGINDLAGTYRRYGGRMIRKSAAIAALLLVTALIVAWFVWRVPRPDRALLPFPVGKDCAIAIVDDTDFFQFDTVSPVYEALAEHGIVVTKTVWVFDAEGRRPERVGLSLSRTDYRKWVEDRLGEGHEIVLHSASAGDDTRSTTLAAYRFLREELALDPRVDVFHSSNREAFYWGGDRLPPGPMRWGYRRLSDSRFEGNDPASPFYWSDVSRSLVRYVRGFAFNEIDTWMVNPSMPYEDPSTPDAPFWFASSNGRKAEEFVELLRPGNVARLADRKGVSIVYTHFASGFTKPEADGRRTLLPAVSNVFQTLRSESAVETVPAGVLLDRLRALQIVRAALEERMSVVRLPADLILALRETSVLPDSLPDGLRGPATDRSPEPRIALLDFLQRCGMKVEIDPRGVFVNPVRIGARERWRLVAHWLVTQIRTQT